jgi:hypothetical protein
MASTFRLGNRSRSSAACGLLNAIFLRGYARRRNSAARTRSRNCSGVSVDRGGAGADFGFTMAGSPLPRDRKCERPFLPKHRKLLACFLGAAISLDPIWRCHDRSLASKGHYIKPGRPRCQGLPGLRRGVASASSSHRPKGVQVGQRAGLSWVAWSTGKGLLARGRPRKSGGLMLLGFIAVKSSPPACVARRCRRPCTAAWFGSTGDQPAAERRAASRRPCGRAGRPG